MAESKFFFLFHLVRIFNTQTNKNKIKALALIWNDCIRLKVKYNVLQRVFFFLNSFFFSFIERAPFLHKVFQSIENGDTYKS